MTETSGVEPADTRVGFVGLGNIGRPMAQRLLAWPGGLVVFDLAPEPVAELEKAGARAATSVADLASECGVVCVMVNTDDQVRDVMGEVLGAAGAGTVVVVHSTISPDLPPRLEDLAGRHDLLFVDAPVSGGAMGAADGTLAIMVGGTDAAFAAARGALGLMGTEVVHCGPAGNGTAAKLARNLLHFVAFTATGEALRLAEAAGIDLVALGRIVRHTDSITGGPGAIMHRDTTAPLGPGDGWTSIFEHVLAIGSKDLAHAIVLADRLGVDVPMAQYAAEHLGEALGLAGAGAGGSTIEGATA
ncbi:NAD(P)-dependent oxidoreductase [Nocardioides pocheonensis]|uniref:NAD(P)-dependent oxidoreductase n=1 Tax=Nocardioides pocheonensis TaxID=661485 RepID=A0A3N0GRK7_9ACTN|nr:NAD(P)-dependent oxidoreductase [Nocardioides pocheonensis]RNM14762.1 NAD(P)-dependent oxidoreductase [Nocardioides pocheonensis]